MNNALQAGYAVDTGHVSAWALNTHRLIRLPTHKNVLSKQVRKGRVCRQCSVDYFWCFWEGLGHGAAR